jgi:hypothetical protein
LNGDGKVNIQDVAIAAKAYGSKPRDPQWNIEADIDGNDPNHRAREKFQK